MRLLLERPGEVVSRDELREKLWPADTFVDFDHGVNAAVNRLRETLGDSADNPGFVETLPRRGYRFIARLECRAENGTEILGWARNSRMLLVQTEQWQYGSDAPDWATGTRRGCRNRCGV